jgi:hypothetical protein
MLHWEDSLAFVVHNNGVVAFQGVSFRSAFQSRIHDEPISSVFSIFVPSSSVLWVTHHTNRKWFNNL